LDVKNKKDNGDSKKADGCIEGVNIREHREDFFNINSPEDVDEKNNANNG
jgi:molybdopterin-guanine dinucleotide biosynthesis protein A